MIDLSNYWPQDDQPIEKLQKILRLQKFIGQTKYGTDFNVSTCKICMRPSGKDFSVPDEEWNKIIGVDCIVCLNCYRYLKYELQEQR